MKDLITEYSYVMSIMKERSMLEYISQEDEERGC